MLETSVMASSGNAGHSIDAEKFTKEGGVELLEELVNKAGLPGNWKYRIVRRVHGSEHSPPLDVMGKNISGGAHVKVRPPKGDNGSVVLIALDGHRLREGPEKAIAALIKAGKELSGRAQTDLQAARSEKLSGKELLDVVRAVKTAWNEGKSFRTKESFLAQAGGDLNRAAKDPGEQYAVKEVLSVLRMAAAAGALVERESDFIVTAAGNDLYFGRSTQEEQPAAAARPPAEWPVAPAAPSPAPAAPAKREEAAFNIEAALDSLDLLEEASALKQQLKSLRAQQGIIGANLGAADRALAERLPRRKAAMEELEIKHLLEREELERRLDAEDLPFKEDVEAARSDLESLRNQCADVDGRLKEKLASIFNFARS